jgi:hypothetical protein
MGKAKPAQRRIKVRVLEEISETTVIELDIPHDLDLNDREAVNDFLEEEFVEGRYVKVEKACEFAIDERSFSGIEVLP